jgi:hypothetical protein
VRGLFHSLCVLGGWNGVEDGQLPPDRHGFAVSAHLPRMAIVMPAWFGRIIRAAHIPLHKPSLP